MWISAYYKGTNELIQENTINNEENHKIIIND